MFTFMASSRISGAMYLWGTQGQFAGAAPTKGCAATCQSPVSPRGAGSSALPSPGIQGDQDERHTMGQRAPFHSRDCNLVTQRQGGTGDTAGGEAVRSHPTSHELPHPPPGAHAGVLGNVDGVQHRVVLHRQPQVGDGAGLVPLHQDVLGFQIPVCDRRLPCSQQEKPPPILITTVCILI